MAGLPELWEHQRRHGARLYVGLGVDGTLALARPQQTVLVLGPPRSGKTSTLVVPNVLAAPGAVISTSTKPEVMEATAAARSQGGRRTWLFDPSGTTPAPPGVTPIRWSPVASSATWRGALQTARCLARTTRPGRGGEADHWTERAEALIAPVLHAAALGGQGMRTVQRWVLGQDLTEPAAVVARAGQTVAAQVLSGLRATHEREMSGIWSTAAGVLAAYRDEGALAASEGVNADPSTLAASGDTVYLCAPAREQELLAPITVAFVETACHGAYDRHRVDASGPPLTLVLDEVANIAPLPSLPSVLSEGAGQGVATVACLQDLSQAEARWGKAAEGFTTLFGAKVILPGISHPSTLDQVSRLGGEVDVPARSTSAGPWWSKRRGVQESWSPRRQRRLPVESVAQQPPGGAVIIAGAKPPEQVILRPWPEIRLFAEAGHHRARQPTVDLPDLGR